MSFNSHSKVAGACKRIRAIANGAPVRLVRQAEEDLRIILQAGFAGAWREEVRKVRARLEKARQEQEARNSPAARAQRTAERRARRAANRRAQAERNRERAKGQGAGRKVA